MQLDKHLMEWMRESTSRWQSTTGGELERDVTEFMHLLMVLGWVERRHFAQQLAVQGLTIPQFFTLVAIHHHAGGCTMGNLAEETQQCSATMTGIVDRLLKTGLVQRLRDEKDRRLVFVSLTDIGRRTIREVLEKKLERLRDVLAQMDATQRSQIVASLHIFVDKAQSTAPQNAEDHLPC